MGDDLALVAIPAEVFTEFGLEIKAGSPLSSTFLLGYTNGYIGYIPSQAEYQRSGYAAVMVPKMADLFPFRPDVGEVLTKTVLSLLQDSC